MMGYFRKALVMFLTILFVFAIIFVLEIFMPSFAKFIPPLIIGGGLLLFLTIWVVRSYKRGVIDSPFSGRITLPGIIIRTEDPYRFLSAFIGWLIILILGWAYWAFVVYKVINNYY